MPGMVTGGKPLAMAEHARAKTSARRKMLLSLMDSSAPGFEPRLALPDVDCLIDAVLCSPRYEKNL